MDSANLAFGDIIFLLNCRQARLDEARIKKELLDAERKKRAEEQVG